MYSYSKALRLITRCVGCKVNRAQISQQLRFNHSPAASSNSSSTVDSEEVKRFTQHSHSWWDTKGEYAALHTMNQLRLPLIKQAFTSLPENTPTPLSGKTILDVGCGGGLLSEPMCRLGATVTGLDATESSVDAADKHRLSLREPQLEKNLSYVCDTVENYCVGRENVYDLVVASEVVEHVNSLDTFIKSCIHMIKPGGGIVVTTINKTQLSYMLTIIAAEYILGMVPKGTHDWEKFVEPKKLTHLFEKYGCEQTLLHGMVINPVTLQWCWIQSTDCNYAARFIKHQPSTASSSSSATADLT